jgi:hypothetical protein
MVRGSWFAAVLGVMLLWPTGAALAEVVQPIEAITEPPTTEPTSEVAEDAPPEETAAEELPAVEPAEPITKPSKEKLARIWANEPPLVRLARDKFGAEFTETDARFFAAVAASEWADFRPSADAKYETESADSWNESPVLDADRITWLCTDPDAARLVPSYGIWLTGASIRGKVYLYRATVPFSLAFNKCYLESGVNIRNAKLQELTISDCCSVRIDARGVQVAENVYMMRTSVYGGLDFIEAQIAGDLDLTGGLAFHGFDEDDTKKPGVAIDLYDAKIDGDVKLSDGFRALGKVRLTGARIGRSINCAGGKFTGLGESSIDAGRAQVGRNITLSGGAVLMGCVDLRSSIVGGDLDCSGARLDGKGYSALYAELIDIAGQVNLNNGLHAKGEVRLVNAVIAKDVNCDNGHFMNSSGNALNFDSTEIGRSLRMGYDNTAATEPDSDLHPGFVAHGTVRLYGTHVSQDLLAAGAHIDRAEDYAIVASNLRVATRMVLSGAEVKGIVDLASADIEHELDLRGSHFDGSKAPNRLAIWANGLKVHGHFNTHRVEMGDEVYRFRVDGQASFVYAEIAKSWNLYGAEFHNPGGDALDASDCRVGNYVALQQAELNGRVSFSRAKIDGMFILTHTVKPEGMTLDMRFAHVWVIKEEKLDDWPPAGQLQLEGFVYDHFDDDSPLSVDDRLAWLRRQYAPLTAVRRGSHDPAETAHVRRGSPDPAATADRRSQGSETFGQSHVRGQETRAQQADLDAALEEGFIMPVGFDSESSIPAPSMAAPTSEPQLEAPPIAQSEAPDTSSVPMMVAPSEATEPAGESAEAADSAVAAAPAQPAAPPDPAGRRYITQPYTQLASVYRAIGQDEQANAVLVARAERLGELAAPLSAQGLWYRYIGRLIGYGYEPFRAIKIGGAIVLFGALIFTIGARRGLMAETKLAEHVLSKENEGGVVSPTYPRFNPLVYSLDVFLPFADLHQRCYWIPGERLTKPRTSRNCFMHIGPYSVKWSGLLRSYLWFQTLAGWTLCTLLAAAVTGIVQS